MRLSPSPGTRLPTADSGLVAADGEFVYAVVHDVVPTANTGTWAAADESRVRHGPVLLQRRWSTDEARGGKARPGYEVLGEIKFDT